MKNLFLLSITLLISTTCISQLITYNEVVSSEKRPKGNFTEYQSSNGEVFKVGQDIVFGEPTNFNDTYENIILTDNLSYQENASGASGYKSEIVKLSIYGTKRLGFGVRAIGRSTVIGKYQIYIEKALEKGEIVSEIMTRGEAIAKLKEAKDLLDLEMMTQEEYDKLRKELTPFIKQ